MDILTLLLLAKLSHGLRFPGSFLSSALVALLLASLPFSVLGFAITALVPTARTALVIALVVSDSPCSSLVRCGHVNSCPLVLVNPL